MKKSPAFTELETICEKYGLNTRPVEPAPDSSQDQSVWVDLPAVVIIRDKLNYKIGSALHLYDILPEQWGYLKTYTDNLFNDLTSIEPLLTPEEKDSTILNGYSFNGWCYYFAQELYSYTRICLWQYPDALGGQFHQMFHRLPHQLFTETINTHYSYAEKIHRTQTPSPWHSTAETELSLFHIRQAIYSPSRYLYLPENGTPAPVVTLTDEQCNEIRQFRSDPDNLQLPEQWAVEMISNTSKQ